MSLNRTPDFLMSKFLTSADEIVPLCFWVVAEAGTLIIAICIPAIHQLGKRGWQHGLRSLFNSKNLEIRRRENRLPESARLTERLQEPKSSIKPMVNSGRPHTMIFAGARLASKTGDDVPSNLSGVSRDGEVYFQTV